MGETEVTFDQYYAFATATGRDLPAMELQNTGNHPVVGVSWQEATDYAAWLTTSTGSETNPYRLPTEAQCEMAASTACFK